MMQCLLPAVKDAGYREFALPVAAMTAMAATAPPPPPLRYIHVGRIQLPKGLARCSGGCPT
jgi:hypothetical protein